MESKINYRKINKEIKKFVKESVSDSRYKHSLRTAKMCKKLCNKYGFDKNKAYLAGLAHDMCKKFTNEKLISLVEEGNLQISSIEQDKPALLHGKAASVLIQKKFQIKDSEIIEAIANHTFGNTNLSSIAKVLYVADKIEEERPQVSKEYYKNLFSKDFDNLVYTVVNESVEYLTKKGKNISKVTKDFLEELDEIRIK